MENQNNPLDQRFVEMQNAETVLIPADKGKRFLNSIVDSIIIYVIDIILLAGIGFVWGVDSIKSLGVIYLTYFISFFFYYVTLENGSGKTVGKILTKTKVVLTDGQKPTLTTIFLRTLCRIIPLEAFTFLGSNGLHDRLSKTIVINTNSNA